MAHGSSRQSHTNYRLRDGNTVRLGGKQPGTGDPHFLSTKLKRNAVMSGMCAIWAPFKEDDIKQWAPERLGVYVLVKKQKSYTSA